MLETPVGIVTYIFLPPNGCAYILDVDMLLDIAKASGVYSENGYQKLHRKSTTVVTNHVSVPATPPYHSSQCCVCACVCNMHIFNLKSIPDFSCR